MSNNPEYVEKFFRFLRDANWHAVLLDVVTNFLEKPRYTSLDIDGLLMSSTKAVEGRCVDASVYGPLQVAQLTILLYSARALMIL
jgi:hypothetical protein